MKILFLNFELGFDCGSQLMQGWTGKTYGGPSRWHPTLAAQSVELEVTSQADWLGIIRDLKDAWHLPLRRWVPLPDFAALESPARPPAAMEFEAGYNLGMDGRPLPDGASDSAKAGHRAAKKSGAELPKENDEALRGIPFFSLRKMAKELGLDVADPKLKGVERLRAAILNANRASKLAEA